MEGVLSDPDKDPDLTVATSMSDDTTKPISSTEIYESLDSSSICSGVTKENLIFFLQYFAKIYTEKEVKEAKVISMALGVSRGVSLEKISYTFAKISNINLIAKSKNLIKIPKISKQF